MRLFRRLILSFILLLEIHQNVSAQENIVFFEKGNLSSISISLIDSITCQAPNLFNLHLFERENAITVPTDSALFYLQISDTLFITYEENEVRVQNPHLERFRVDHSSMNVNVSASGKQPFVCVASGECENGRLIIDSDTTCTLVLSGLKLVSQEGSAIYFRQKQKSTVELSEGTINILEDAIHYNKTDTTDISCAALYSKGSISIGGTGILNVRGNYRHAIFSSKNLNIDDGTINILDAQKDGIHCDKYKQKGGTVNLNLTQTATKGIKTKEEFELKGGRIEGEATADLKIANGETSYCTFIKSDSLFTMSGGDMQLTHSGKGGRCISVDKNFLMMAGRMSLECHGDGGSYLTAANDSDYYTPKCITVNGITRIERGYLSLQATGQGGKGLDCSDTIFIGRNGDDFLNEDLLLLNVQTHGWCMEDNVNEDYRSGCPKAVKCDEDIYLYSGTLRINTYGQGGEGIEAKGSLRAYHSTVIADCYDDGINTGKRCYIDGAHIFCRSINNDGIDSNGKMSVMDGIVSAISEHYENESFDTEGTSFNLYGGHIIGIGNDEVSVSQQSTIPYYSTPSWCLRFGYQCGDSIAIQSNQYLTISKGNEAIVSLRHEYGSPDAFITVASADMQKGISYQIRDGEQPLSPSTTWLDDRVIIGGAITNEQESLFHFQAY